MHNRAMMTPSTNDESILFEGHPAIIPSIGALLLGIFTLGIAVIYYWVRSQSKHYRITNQRIVIETGLFSKRMDQIDTYRINDYVVERPFGQRIMGTGNLLIASIDRTTPEIRIEHLKIDTVHLYEQLRKATEEQKARRGVRTLDTTEHLA